MKKIITAALACVMILSSLCGCAAKEELPPLPEKYSLMEENRVTVSKNQRKSGMCAAFAAVNICESALITDGLAKADDIDLSEGHTFYYLYHFADEKDPGAAEDRIYLSGSRRDSLNMMFNVGANPAVILNAFANGAGPADESIVWFNTDDMRKSAEMMYEAHMNGSADKFTGDYLVTGTYSYGAAGDIYEQSSIEDIKRAILSDGAVLAAMCAETGAYSVYEGGIAYYSHDKADGDITPNHITSIIGWDDNFPRENFGSDQPAGNGAWLIQDSQGPDFGNDGCYWMSYDEALMGFAGVDLRPRSDYGDILYYDSLNMNDTIKSPKGDTVTANVFSAERDCALKAAGIQTSAKNQPVEIKIFRNPEAGVPDSGERAAVIKTTVEKPGYNVIDLEAPVALSAGDTFSIVVTYSAGRNQLAGTVPVEGSNAAGMDFYFVPVEFSYTSGAGESYVIFDGVWHDTSDPATAALFGKDAPINNFGIKALMDKE